MASLGSSLRTVTSDRHQRSTSEELGDLAREQPWSAHNERPGENRPDPAALQRNGDLLEKQSKGRPELEMENDSNLFDNEEEDQHSNADANLEWRRADPSITQ